MKENVGRIDQLGRLILGPALAVAGYTTLGGSCGRVRGLAALVAGALILESAVTRVCPLNGLLRLDTRSSRLRDRDLQALQGARRRRMPEGATVPPPMGAALY
jgi:hypothetical protein